MPACYLHTLAHDIQDYLEDESAAERQRLVLLCDIYHGDITALVTQLNDLHQQAHAVPITSDMCHQALQTIGELLYSADANGFPVVFNQIEDCYE